MKATRRKAMTKILKPRPTAGAASWHGGRRPIVAGDSGESAARGARLQSCATSGDRSRRCIGVAETRSRLFAYRTRAARVDSERGPVAFPNFVLPNSTNTVFKIHVRSIQCQCLGRAQSGCAEKSDERDVSQSTWSPRLWYNGGLRDLLFREDVRLRAVPATARSVSRLQPREREHVRVQRRRRSGEHRPAARTAAEQRWTDARRRHCWPGARRSTQARVPTSHDSR